MCLVKVKLSSKNSVSVAIQVKIDVCQFEHVQFGLLLCSRLPLNFKPQTVELQIVWVINIILTGLKSLSQIINLFRILLSLPIH